MPRQSKFHNVQPGQKFDRWTFIEVAPDAATDRQVRWKCQCDCGTLRVIRASEVVAQQSRSCGCLRSDRVRESLQKGKGHSGFNQVWLNYRASAKRRGHSWGLSKDEFREITQSPCHYCGARNVSKCTPNTRVAASREWASYSYNGIDRRDNGLGYERSNCLPCCDTCNRAKLVATEEEFYAWIKRVAAEAPWEKPREYNGPLPANLGSKGCTEDGAA